MSGNDGTEIIECLEEQKSGYNQLLHLASKQKEAIAGGDDTLLMSVVQDKNKCLDSIRKSEARMEAALKGMSPQDLQRLQARGGLLRDEVVALIESLIQVESECVDSLEAKKSTCIANSRISKTAKKASSSMVRTKATRALGFPMMSERR